MILLCGIPTEPPMALVTDELAALGAPFLFLNQRNVARWDVAMEISDDGLSGWVEVEGRSFSLADFTGIYARLMDDRELPEFKAAPEGSLFRKLCRARHEVLLRWIELAPARVLNRAAAMASNFSKPYQAQFIVAAGFEVPPTLVTNDPAAVRKFRRCHGRIIYKSISSARSIVREFTDADEARLAHIRWCPTQFQAFIPGTNVRVHVAGEAVLATEIVSDAADYRYAQSETGAAAELRPRDLDAALSQRCHALAHGLDLPLAGIDLKITPEGRVYCFEVNPSPAFSYYESHTGQPIARAIAQYLAEPGRSVPESESSICVGH